MQSKNILVKALDKSSVQFDANLELRSLWVADETRPEIYSSTAAEQSRYFWDIRVVEHREK